MHQRDLAPSFRIELLNTDDQRVVDGEGYRTLHEASLTIEYFFTAAKRLSGIEDPGESRPVRYDAVLFG